MQNLHAARPPVIPSEAEESPTSSTRIQSCLSVARHNNRVQQNIPRLWLLNSVWEPHFLSKLRFIAFQYDERKEMDFSFRGGISKLEFWEQEEKFCNSL